MKPRHMLPILYIALFCCSLYGIVNIISLATYRDYRPVEAFHRMMDYDDFYNASKMLFTENKNIYNRLRFVTPPLAAVLNYPLIHLPREQAKTVVAWLIVLSMIACAIMSATLLIPSSGSLMDNIRNLVINTNHFFLTLCGSLMLILLFSYPFYFLFERGNIDWLVLSFVWLMLLSVHCGHKLLGGLCIGFAICLKVYPIILIIPLVLKRQWMAIAGALIGIVISISITLKLWITFIQHRVLDRADTFRVSENVSLSASFYHMFHIFSSRVMKVLVFRSSQVLFVLLIAGLAYCIYRKRRVLSNTESILLFIPMMLLMPNTVYPYELIFIPFLLPFLCNIRSCGTLNMNRWIIVAFAGSAMTQIQATQLHTATGLQFMHVIPAWGLLILAVSCVGIAWSFDKKTWIINLNPILLYLTDNSCFKYYRFNLFSIDT